MRRFDADLRREFKGFHYTIMAKLPGENEFDIREQFFVGERIPEDKSAGTPERFKVLSNGFDVPFRKKLDRLTISPPKPYMTPGLKKYLDQTPFNIKYDVVNAVEEMVEAIAGGKPYVTTKERQLTRQRSGTHFGAGSRYARLKG